MALPLYTFIMSGLSTNECDRYLCSGSRGSSIRNDPAGLVRVPETLTSPWNSLFPVTYRASSAPSRLTQSEGSLFVALVFMMNAAWPVPLLSTRSPRQFAPLHATSTVAVAGLATELSNNAAGPRPVVLARSAGLVLAV